MMVEYIRYEVVQFCLESDTQPAAHVSRAIVLGEP